MSDYWLNSVDFARLAGISRQVANRLLSAFLAGRTAPWRGTCLIVREVAGVKGGRAGTGYLVRFDSLPPEVQGDLNPTLNPVQLALPLQGTSTDSTQELIWWTHHLKPILKHEPRTEGRTAAIEALLAQELLDWQGRPLKLSRTRLYERIRKMEAGGIGAMKRQRRKDAGQGKFLISREWDSAVPFDLAIKQKIADELRGRLRKLHSERTQRKIALELHKAWLKRVTTNYGFRPNDPAVLDRICRIPMKLYTEESAYRIVYDLKKDRDRFDNNAPRIKRSIRNLRPMEIVVGDVHPLDVRIERRDGTVGAARLIAFMDVATKRVYWDVVMIEGQGGIRNTDVMKTFLGMCQDPAFGVPQNLYLDNGSEYRFAEYLDEALRLNAANAQNARLSTIVRAQPYNAAAKEIEGWFHKLEDGYLRHVQGWHGGKLGAPMRPAPGKLPAAYNGGFDAFTELLSGFIAAYHVMPQPFGVLEGDSPNQRFGKFVEKGWAATVMDPEHVLSVFCKSDVRQVRQHAIQVDGRTWTAPELDMYTSDRVSVRIPQLGLGFNELWVGDDRGKFLCYAKPQEVTDYFDTRGALHSADRKAEAREVARKMARNLPAIDIGGELRGLVMDQMPTGANPPTGIISVTSDEPKGKVIVPRKPPEKTMTEYERRERQSSAEERAYNNWLKREGRTT